MNKESEKKRLKLTLPPLLTVLFMLSVFAFNGMYPFGDNSIAKDDAIRQLVPLLAEFKDVLEGRSSFFLNFQISGGANFYGIFLYYLASPFSFLVKFVDKANLPGFFNVLVMVKMVTAAFTAAYSFTVIRRKLETFWVVLFSMTYAFSGYVVMYYVIISWLDVVYLFPLLIVGLYRLEQDSQPLTYIVILALSCLFNYYLTYMLGIFVLLFTGGYLVLNYHKKGCSRVCRQILLGSLGAFLLTAVFWFPSYVQYLSSARAETTVVQSIFDNELFFYRYSASLPLLMAQALPWVLISGHLLKRRRRSKDNNLCLLLLFLTVIPFIVEPINLLWHTGNYMGFPCRFSFITIFLALFCSAYAAEDEDTDEKRADRQTFVGVIVLGIILLGCAGWLIITVLNDSLSGLDRYVEHLWADAQSMQLIGRLFIAFLTLYGLAYWAYCRQLLVKRTFFVFVSCIFLLEALANIDIYFICCAKTHEDWNRRNTMAYSLGGKIADDSFYRVKTRDINRENCIGSWGYNSISSYTSLNGRDYMTMMKGLGYSGAWLAMSSYGGTELTDALLSIKYEVNGDGNEKDFVYKSSAGSIARLPYSLPMGLYLKKGTLKYTAFFPDNCERTEIQRFLGRHIIGDNVVKKYIPKKMIKKSKGRYVFKKNDNVDYRIWIDQKTSLYLDLYDGFSTSLYNPLSGAAEVSVNGVKLKGKYPTTWNNGLLFLGTYEDTAVNVSLCFDRNVKCRSFGLFGLDVNKLGEFCLYAQGADLIVKDKGLYGKCCVPEDCSLFVSLPYSDNFVVKVNGERTKYERIFTDFVVFDLPKGDNEISITFTPKGLGMGAFISCIGLLFSVCYVKLSPKLEVKKDFDKITKVITGAICAAAVLGVYILPVLIKLFC